MFFHHKGLAYTVRVDKPNPVFARMLQQAIGGPEGEMRVMLQYLFQAWGSRGPKKYRDMLIHTGTEEIGHIEVLATAVSMNLDGLPSEKVDDVVTNPLVSARMGGVEPRHFLSAAWRPCLRTRAACHSMPPASTWTAICSRTCARTSPPSQSAGACRAAARDDQ